MNIEWYQIVFLMYLSTAVTYSEQAIPTRQFSTDGFPLKKKIKIKKHTKQNQNKNQSK